MTGTLDPESTARQERLKPRAVVVKYLHIVIRMMGQMLLVPLGFAWLINYFDQAVQIGCLKLELLSSTLQYCSLAVSLPPYASQYLSES